MFGAGAVGFDRGGRLGPKRETRMRAAWSNLKTNNHKEVQLAASLNKYLAELLGTFVLVGVGSLAILSSGGSVVAISLGFGLAVFAAIHMFGSVSGAHVNPALTLAKMMRKEISAADTAGYVVAQLAGAALAAGLIAGVSGNSGVKATLVRGGEIGGGRVMDAGEIFILELILTVVLVIVFLRVTSGEGKGAPYAIAGALTVIHLAAAPLTGGSVNPVRSLGPAIVAGDYTNVWAYVLAPLAGAVIGVFLDKFVNEGNGADEA